VLQPEIVALDSCAFDADAVTYGPFRSERDAWRALEGKAREAGLCLKLLGREAGDGSCFARQLGHCRGACVGREPLALHDARLQLALASLRVKPWPFPGAVGIREPAPGGLGTVLHVIDRWQHLGTARDAAEIASLLESRSVAAFDADAYRIISRRLARCETRDLVLLGGGARS
jgi:DNA polymerase-3 subunit epsilon